MESGLAPGKSSKINGVVSTFFDPCTHFRALYTLSLSIVRLGSAWVNYIVSTIKLQLLEIFG